MTNDYSVLADILSISNNIVFFGGAGVSTECGIPDFRSKNGLYNKTFEYNYTPEVMLSYSFFKSHPDIFYDFLINNLLKYDVMPNKGHTALAELESLGKLQAIITQNIDNLHQLAGSKKVLELHGTLSNFYCPNCLKNYSKDYVNTQKTLPYCECGGIIRPDIVLYEEALDERILEEAIAYIHAAEILIVAGTSLAVYPAAGLLRYFKGSKLIIINHSSTTYDSKADLVIHASFGETMGKVMQEMNIRRL
jgi:NAD-dependent deacetylase